MRIDERSNSRTGQAQALAATESNRRFAPTLAQSLRRGRRRSPSAERDERGQQPAPAMFAAPLATGPVAPIAHAMPAIVDRLDRVVRMAESTANGPTLTATVGLSSGEHVELSVRASAVGVQILIAAPAALAAALEHDRHVLCDRLAARGVRVRGWLVRVHATRPDRDDPWGGRER